MEENSNMDWSLLFGALAAIGTVAVAILAIWGEWFRSKFAGPKLVLVPHNFRGTDTTLSVHGGMKVQAYKAIYYHLKVKNNRRWASVKNCRVLLRQLHRRGPDGKFHAVSLVVPLQFVWSPAEWAPTEQSFTDEAILDFGRLIEGTEFFEPLFYVTSANFQGYIKANEAVRFTLQIVADNYSAIKYQVFEVAWDGKFDENLDKMEQSLRIKVINEKT